MQKFFVAGALTLCATAAFAASFPAPPLYPSFTERKAQIENIAPKNSSDAAAIGIDASGRVFGLYFDSNNLRHGFIRRVDGSFRTFQAPGAGTGAQQGTTPVAVNAAGNVAGFYAVGGSNGNVDHGFLLIGKTFTAFDPPHSQSTMPAGINKSDAITGWFHTAKFIDVGFLRTPDGKVTTFKVPGASTEPDSGTTPECINDSGVIAGEFQDTNNKFHGFVRDAHGKLTTFDPPKSTFTSASAINAAGVIIGSFTTNDEVEHGYVRAADGSITVFNLGSDATGDTAFHAINDNGDITGTIRNRKGKTVGFLRKANGNVTTFKDPAVANVKGGGTIPAAINASDAIAGSYINGNDIPLGFVRLP